MNYPDPTSEDGADADAAVSTANDHCEAMKAANTNRHRCLGTSAMVLAGYEFPFGSPGFHSTAPFLLKHFPGCYKGMPKL